MLKRLQEFTEHIDMGELEQKVRLNWKHRRTHGKRIHQAAVNIDEGRSNKIAPWIEASRRA